jgi:hypothetical protein
MPMNRCEQNGWVDAVVRSSDPFPEGLGGGALDSAVEHAGHRILRSVSEEPWQSRRRRLFRAPRRLALVGLVVLGASGAAAAASGLFVNANTHSYAQRSDLRHGMGAAAWRAAAALCSSF